MSLGDWSIVCPGDWSIVSLGDWSIVSLVVWAIMTLGIEFHRKVEKWQWRNGMVLTSTKQNFLKNSADKIQVLSYLNVAVDHGRSIKEIVENLYDDHHDDKEIAELLLR